MLSHLHQSTSEFALCNHFNFEMLTIYLYQFMKKANIEIKKINFKYKIKSLHHYVQGIDL